MARYAKQRKEYPGWIPTKDDILWMVKWWTIAIIACLALTMLGVAQGHAQWDGDDKHHGPVTIRTYPHLMLSFSDSTATTNVTQDAWYHITNTSNNLFANQYCENISCAGDSIIIQIEGDYYVTMNINFAGNNGESWNVGIMKNGVITPFVKRIDTTANNDVTECSVQGYFDNLERGDRIKAIIMNTTDDDDPTFYSGSFWMRWEFN